MIIADDIQTLQDSLQPWREQGLKIGFVPTMGHLHDGHISLVNTAQAQCDRVVVSIFVNPLQFNQSSDFDAYPKTLEQDRQKLLAAGVDLLFMPDAQMMYPNGQETVTKVRVPGVTEALEGAFRPGHFDGVATVVLKLFNLVRPDLSVFGEKDYQQLMMIRKMVRDLDLPIDIIAGETLRESDGLAMSSRNSRLNLEQRKLASGLYQVLQDVSQQLAVAQPSEVEQLEAEAIRQLELQQFKVEYFSLRSGEDLSIPSGVRGQRLLVAAWLGNVRLIDNIVID